MSKLITKARAGVTLVELLVVILIVTILSVSMLPLLQPFVVESQYAAEAIPVIGNIRTKVGIYQYDKGKLPCIAVTADDGTIAAPEIESWLPTDAQNVAAPAADRAEADYYCPAHGVFSGTDTASYSGVMDAGGLVSTDPLFKDHLQTLCDIDYQDLKGKRSRPQHYQYLVMRNGANYAYIVGCFGDGNGLKMGTGYAVCEIVAAGHKYVGTWKRYKPVSDANGNDSQVCFTSTIDANLPGTKQLGCYVPVVGSFTNAQDVNGKLDIIDDMDDYGWEF